MAKRAKQQEPKPERNIEEDPNWWCGNSLRISSHAIDRARERCPKSMAELAQRMFGSLLAGAIYNPRGKPVILEPDKDHVYQVALPFFNAKEQSDKPIGFAVIAPDKEESNIIVCRTFLEPDSYQLYDRDKQPIPLWYIRFKDRIS